MDVVLLVGVATMYTGPLGAPLFCDGWDTEWMYDPALEPWVALDAGLYESGRVRCGAPVRMEFEDGRVVWARALDAGRLEGYCVQGPHPPGPHPPAPSPIGMGEGECMPIVVDVPQHLAPFVGLSAPVRVEVGLEAF